MNMQNHNMIDDYLGCEVDILYLTDNGVYHDVGTLAAADGPWMRLQKGQATFLIPMTAIRIIKVLKYPDAPENNLLRPAASPASIESKEPERASFDESKSE